MLDSLVRVSRRVGYDLHVKYNTTMCIYQSNLTCSKYWNQIFKISQESPNKFTQFPLLFYPHSANHNLIRNYNIMKHTRRFKTTIFRILFIIHTDYLTHKSNNTSNSEIRIKDWTIKFNYSNKNTIVKLWRDQLNRLHPLLHWQFQALLTLFSKFFSPFVHTTCLLSVLFQYLALDEIYHLY
jgi:hypothetical protein